MNSYIFIPLVATVAYIPLFTFSILSRPIQKHHILFATYLLSATVWSLSAFLLRSDFLIQYNVLLFQFVICSFTLTIVQFYYFIRFYFYKSAGPGIILGYALVIYLIIDCFLGHIPQSIHVRDGIVAIELGGRFIPVAIASLILISLLIYYLVRKFRFGSDHIERNRIIYFLSSIIIVTVFATINIIPNIMDLPIAHIGNLLNAGILTYATLKYHILDVRFIARRGLVYVVMVCLSLFIYSFWLVLLHRFLNLDLSYGSITIVVLLTVFSTTVIWIYTRMFMYRKIDEIFYGESYKYRQILTDFIKQGINNVFNLRELANGLLPPLIKVLDCQQVHMLLRKADTGDFFTEFSEPDNHDTHTFRIKHNSPIIEWLRQENRYLTRDNIDVYPGFHSIQKKEKSILQESGIELFFPLISRGKLIGILALGRKKSGNYSVEDIDLVKTISNQIAMGLEKEYLQEELRKREQELSLINRLTGVMTSSLNIQEVYDAFVTELREVVDVDLATITLIEGNEIYIAAVSASTKVGEVWQLEQRIPLKETATEWVVTHKKSVVERDLSHNRMFYTGDEYLKQGIRSIIYLPLISKGTGIGSLIIASRHPNAYTQEQVSPLERLASQISTSIANAQLYAKAEQRARIDELTGLFNRRHFDESVKREIGRHSRYSSMFSLVFLDLDNFKHYNDIKGHPAGDRLLTLIGQLLKGTLRNIDFAFRYGGDEFAIIMPETIGDDALSASERVRQIITSEMEEQHINVTSSLGLASWPSDGVTADDIINAADKALYYAKRTGGNRTCAVSQMLSPLSDIAESTTDTEKETLNTIYALAATIEARDPYTYGHSRKVRGYAVALAESIGLPAEKVAVISHAALLHDIGKIGILDEILNKAGKLNSDEFELIKTHPQLSRTIVGHVPSLTPCLPAILHHHESWDGTGYPSKLKGESIPLEARILTIADAFDAMTSLRPYRDSLSYKEAIEELKRFAGIQFDPKLVKKFLPIASRISTQETEP